MTTITTNWTVSLVQETNLSTVDAEQLSRLSNAFATMERELQKTAEKVARELNLPYKQLEVK